MAEKLEWPFDPRLAVARQALQSIRAQGGAIYAQQVSAEALRAIALIEANPPARVAATA